MHTSKSKKAPQELLSSVFPNELHAATHHHPTMSTEQEDNQDNDDDKTILMSMSIEEGAKE